MYDFFIYFLNNSVNEFGCYVYTLPVCFCAMDITEYCEPSIFDGIQHTDST